MTADFHEMSKSHASSSLIKFLTDLAPLSSDYPDRIEILASFVIFPSSLAYWSAYSCNLTREAPCNKCTAMR